MQSKYINIKGDNNKRIILFSIKLFVTVWSVLFIIQKVDEQGVLLSEVVLPKGFYPTIFLVSILMVINWTLESYRWQVSISPFESISLKRALGDVLGGLALNWVLPFTSGDFIARISSRVDKFKAVSAVLLNRLIMLAFTLVFGCYGVYVFGMWKAVAVSVNATLVFLVIVALTVVVSRNYIKRFWQYFKDLSLDLFFKIILISTTRYFTFTLQVYLMINVFLPSLTSTQLIGGVGWIFFFKSIIPSLFGGLGLREASAFLFFQEIVDDMSFIVVPVLLIWVINTVIPSFFGALLIWKLRLKIAR